MGKHRLMKINPKLEARNSKQIQNPTIQNPNKKTSAKGMSEPQMRRCCRWRRFHRVKLKNFNISATSAIRVIRGSDIFLLLFFPVFFIIHHSSFIIHHSKSPLPFFLSPSYPPNFSTSLFTLASFLLIIFIQN